MFPGIVITKHTRSKINGVSARCYLGGTSRKRYAVPKLSFLAETEAGRMAIEISRS